MIKKIPKEQELVLCTVEKIAGTTVFVRIDKYNVEGTIITSEVAPGRIRNIRDYVVPGKKIVCKVLKIDNTGTIHLSLRRVTPAEKKKVMERYGREKAYENMIRNLCKNHEQILANIKAKHDSLFSFFQQYTKQEQQLLSALMSAGATQQEAEKVVEATKKQKKKVQLKTKVVVKSMHPDGLDKIKQVLSVPGCNSVYVGAPYYTVSVQAEDYKEAEKRLKACLEEMEKKAKQLGCKFFAEEW